MLTHVRRSVPLLAICAGALLPLVVSSCDKVPLLAPTGTVINLFAGSNSVSLNSEVDITATAIENGADVGTGTGSTTRSGAGTPVQNGTVISFTTTIGRIEPSEGRTHNGQVVVKLITANQSGTATITAYSGGASKTLQLKVGSAAASRVLVTATPQTLGSSGGSSTISAQVTDEGGAGISGIPVSFSTDAGTLSASTATTDANGIATTILNTATTATVSVQAGGVAAVTTKVTVGAKPLASFTASPTSTTAGSPVTFTVTPATGANVSGGVIHYGDGDSDQLGAISGAQTFVHSYSGAGQFTATVTANDASGGSQTLTQTVVIGSLAIGLTASPNPVTVGNPTVLTATVPAGTQIASYTFTFDDGTQPVTTTSNTTSHTFTSRGTHTVRVDVIAVGGATGQNITQVAVQ